jgi:hypothetical protein
VCVGEVEFMWALTEVPHSRLLHTSFLLNPVNRLFVQNGLECKLCCSTPNSGNNTLFPRIDDAPSATRRIAPPQRRPRSLWLGPRPEWTHLNERCILFFGSVADQKHSHLTQSRDLVSFRAMVHASSTVRGRPTQHDVLRYPRYILPKPDTPPQ